MEHIVLEYDESTRTALVVATSGGREPVLSGHASPYIVADGYDFESRSWGAGHYFTDIAEAKIDYERSCRHPYPLAEGKLRDDEFCTIRWCREDIAEALSEYLAYPIPATEKNIDAAIGQLMAHDSFQDRSIEDEINFSAAVDSFAFKADTRDLAALRELSDAELASEIEKAGTAMTERVDAHMSHVHGLGGTEADSAAYYAARKWHADLQFESARRLHASTDRGQRESGRDPQAMANAAVKAAKGRDGDAAGHDGIIH